MRLNLATDYALRLLMLLAAEPQRLHTIAEAARRYRVSRSHLMKVAMGLVQGGFAHSVRGRSGGLQLARAAAGIGIGEVVRHFEGRIDWAECFDPTTNTCSIAGGCRLKGVLREAGDAFLAVLDRYSVDDLIGKPALARSLLRQLAA
jgi:Rrf2 family transcriptional regulator, nitric oxide-sensitive transcriptional repressor